MAVASAAAGRGERPGRQQPSAPRRDAADGDGQHVAGPHGLARLVDPHAVDAHLAVLRPAAAASVRDLDEAREPKPLVEPLRAGRRLVASSASPAPSSACSSLLRLSSARLQRASAANGESGSKAGRGAAARPCARRPCGSLVAAACRALAAAIARDCMRSACPSRLRRLRCGAGPCPGRLRLGVPARRGGAALPALRWLRCGRLPALRPRRAAASPCAGGRQTSSRFARPRLRRGRADCARVDRGRWLRLALPATAALSAARRRPRSAAPAAPSATLAGCLGGSLRLRWRRAATAPQRRTARRVGRDRAALEPEAQRLQHVAQLVRRAAEDRHHLRRRREAAVAGRALRRRLGFAASRAPGEQRPDQIGQPLEHVEAHRARPAHVIAGGAIEGLRAAPGSAANEVRPGARRLGQRVERRARWRRRSSATTASGVSSAAAGFSRIGK